MNDDKFLKTDNPFQVLEFEAEIEQQPLTDFKQSLIENEQEAVEREEQSKTASVTSNHEKGIRNQREWSATYNDILLEIFDAEAALEETTDLHVKALLNKGIQVDPHAVFSIIEMVNTRMLKLSVAKRLAHAHGLHAEWSSIMEKELTLIYGSQAPVKPVIRGRPLGEAE